MNFSYHLDKINVFPIVFQLNYLLLKKKPWIEVNDFPVGKKKEKKFVCLNSHTEEK